MREDIKSIKQEMNLDQRNSIIKKLPSNFEAYVTRVKDGDTFEIQYKEHKIPVRMKDIAAAEKHEEGGKRSQRWLKNQIEKKKVQLTINPKNPLEKWGRLLATVHHGGINIGDKSKMLGYSIDWDLREERNVFKKYSEQLKEQRKGMMLNV